jgi:hypothetical protein
MQIYNILMWDKLRSLKSIKIAEPPCSAALIAKRIGR